MRSIIRFLRTSLGKGDSISHLRESVSGRRGLTESNYANCHHRGFVQKNG